MPYYNGQLTPRSILKWTKREIDDDTYIYRPRIDTHTHTDFYLDEDECYSHWWYASNLHFGDKRRPPYKQKFGEYLDSIEVSGADIFGGLNVIDAKLRLLELDKDKL